MSAGKNLVSSVQVLEPASVLTHVLVGLFVRTFGFNFLDDLWRVFSFHFIVIYLCSMTKYATFVLTGSFLIFLVSPDFGFVAMNEHMPHHYSKVAGDL